jgi:hypothetical protein
VDRGFVGPLPCCRDAHDGQREGLTQRQGQDPETRGPPQAPVSDEFKAWPESNLRKPGPQEET